MCVEIEVHVWVERVGVGVCLRDIQYNPQTVLLYETGLGIIFLFIVNVSSSSLPVGFECPVLGFQYDVCVSCFRLTSPRSFS